MMDGGKILALLKLFAHHSLTVTMRDMHWSPDPLKKHID